MKRMFTGLLALLLLIVGAQASRRGQEPRVVLGLERLEAFTGEAYDLTLQARADGFIYLYALDPDGYVSLLYPVLTEDGRGQVRAGDSLFISPLYAGNVPGAERLVAVHTREYRPIKPSRHHFLAPDPQDLTDIHSRLTRSARELDNYDSALLSVLATQVTEELAQEEESTGDSSGGLVIHSHSYDYWCDYCDCWHPACTHSQCWCGWEVMDHYHSHYHYSHCFLWGPWHAWWRPPVIYVYVLGGSPWDYDTRPWRPRRAWSAHREGSGRWRHLEGPRLADPAAFVEKPRRERQDEPSWIPMKERLEPEAPPRKEKPAPSILSTDPLRKDQAEPGAQPTAKPSILSTRPATDPEATPEAPKENSPYLDRLKTTPAPTPGTSKKDKGASGLRIPKLSPKPAVKTEKKPESKPATPAKPESKPDKKPDKKPAKDEPKPEKKPETKQDK
jgi:hypothetical protein